MKRFSRKIESTDSGSMTDRETELVPGGCSIVRERAPVKINLVCRLRFTDLRNKLVSFGCVGRRERTVEVKNC